MILVSKAQKESFGWTFAISSSAVGSGSALLVNQAHTDPLNPRVFCLVHLTQLWEAAALPEGDYTDYIWKHTVSGTIYPSNKTDIEVLIKPLKSTRGLVYEET